MKRIINDENMYSYFHQLLDGKLEFLTDDFSAGRENGLWQKNLAFYDLDQLYRTRKAVYAEEEVCDELCMMDDALQIFQTYFQIPGIDRLLINNYGALENDIFLEFDGNTGKPKRIREHYKHQYRNAYLGSVLLLDCQFLDCMADSVLSSGRVLSQYLKAKLNISPDGTEEEKKRLKRVLYKSYFLSAMFHDIGYPLEFFLRKAEQIHQYAPFYRIISPGIKTNIVEIRAELADSLLFQLIPAEEIEKKYERNDHGCLSAVSFLMNFYASGSIFSFAQTQRCILELSALAIYRHTDRLVNGFMVFEEDPLSYVVRLCDDLQEWERFLLIINEKHNYLKCLKCGSICKAVGRRYSCGCDGGKDEDPQPKSSGGTAAPEENSYRYEKITDIKNKKVNYVCLCESLTVKYKEGELVVDISFDFYKQLEILLDDYCAVIKRQEDLEKVEKYLRYQKGMPAVRLKYFLSNNPIYLFQHILEKNKLTLDKVREDTRKHTGWSVVKKDGMLRFADEAERYMNDDALRKKQFGEKLETNVFLYGQNAAAFVEKYLGQIHTIANWATADKHTVIKRQDING